MAHIQSVLDESLAMVGSTRGHVRKTGKRASVELPKSAASGVEVEVLPSPPVVSLPQIDGAKSASTPALAAKSGSSRSRSSSSSSSSSATLPRAAA